MDRRSASEDVWGDELALWTLGSGPRQSKIKTRALDFLPDDSRDPSGARRPLIVMRREDEETISADIDRE